MERRGARTIAGTASGVVPASWCLAAVVACSAARAHAADAVRVGADRRTTANVTIYNSNLALVREVREVDLPAGVSDLAFEDVATQIRPETVHVKDLGAQGTLGVVEQNYRYDVLGPSALMERYVGGTVDLVHVVPGTGNVVRRQATLLSTGAAPNPYGGGYADPGSYVYDIGGDVTFGGGWRVVLPPEVPAGFVSRPTLFWLLDAAAAGRRRIETSYLTWGMNWKADYVLVLSPDGKKGDLTGWVTLTNNAGISFDDAGLQLVAGQVNVVAPAGGREAGGMIMRGDGLAASGEMDDRGFAEEGMFEYHLYTLQRRTDLADREQKQIELLAGTAVPVERRYELRGVEYWFVSQQNGIMENLHPSVRLEFVNAEDVGLGMPLPAGVVRVYQSEAGRGAGSQFAGEDSIVHTPREERVKLHVGRAFDVVAERRQTAYEVLADGLVETEWEIKIRNRKSETVVVEVREPTSGDWTVVSSSLPHEKVSAREIRFDVTCPPDEEIVLRYRLRVKYY